MIFASLLLTHPPDSSVKYPSLHTHSPSFSKEVVRHSHEVPVLNALLTHSSQMPVGVHFLHLAGRHSNC